MPPRRLSTFVVRTTVLGWLLAVAQSPRTEELAAPVSTIPASRGVVDAPCPLGAISILPGASIQAAVDRALEGATFCLRNGIHRLQAIRPKSGQSFYGEGRTTLNGSRRLTQFHREGAFWIAEIEQQRVRRKGPCEEDVWGCDIPESLFLNERPLTPVPTKKEVKPGHFFLDRVASRVYIVDDPAGHNVESARTVFAFESRARNVTIRNLTIEKYASVAQQGAIQAEDSVGWVIEDCDIRLNSAAGISAGASTQVRRCNIHHNGQIGITGSGPDIRIEDNTVWANNLRSYDTGWEAGGIKIALGERAVFRGNHIHDNVGPGLWCDGDCRDVLYERNRVERNLGAGIFHEISYSAIIRYNHVRLNGRQSDWFWGSNILIAGSQDASIYGNMLTVGPGRCGIMLIDQGRDDRPKGRSGGKYKTQNNSIYENDMTFEGQLCAGGASDVPPDDENATIITDGGNVFDRNIYRVRSESGPARFAWGHAELDWPELVQKDIEVHGRLMRD